MHVFIKVAVLLCQCQCGGEGEVECGDHMGAFGRSPAERTVAGTSAATVEAGVDESETFAAGATGRSVDWLWGVRT